MLRLALSGFVAAVGLIFGLTAHLAAADIRVERHYDGKSFHIFIIGRIENGDEEKFRTGMLGGINAGLSPNGVTIFSPGGSVPPAMAIGRQIRTATMWTGGPVFQDMLGPKVSWCVGPVLDLDGRQLRGGSAEFLWSHNWPRKARGRWTNNDDVFEDPRCTCTSACFLIWAAGVARSKGPIGVHRPYFDRAEYAKLEIKEAMAAYDGMVGKVKDYLREMDVSERIIKKMMAASSEHMVELDARDLEELDNATGGEGLVELQIAKCGSMKEIEDENNTFKVGQRCDKRCQQRIEAFHKKLKERAKCWDTVRDEEGPREAIKAYLARYGQ